MRAAAAHHDGVGYEVELAPDEVAPHRGHAHERTSLAGRVPVPGAAVPQVRQEAREGGIAGPDEQMVGVRTRFVGQRGHVQAAQAHPVVDRERLDVLVDDVDLVGRIEPRRERGQAERREQAVLHGPEVRALGLGERRQDHLHAHRVPPLAT